MPPSQFEIKVKALERLIKEKSMYSSEVNDELTRLEDMKLKDADAYDLKKQDELVRENQRMIPKVEEKIAHHKQQLLEFLKTYDGDENLDVAKDLLNKC